MESLTRFIKYWLKTVGLERTKTENVLNWILKEQWNWNNHILLWEIKGWNAHLSVILSSLWTPSVQRNLFKSRKAQNSGMSRRGNANCWVRHWMRSYVLMFLKKKTRDLRLRLIPLLIQPVFKEHLFCSGVPGLLLWLLTWKGRNELPSQICCCNHSWSDFHPFCKWFL